jgi:3-hydroxybutyryl-CoA dehydrogenase
MVIGAGQMGGGIAQVMAANGHRVSLNDIAQNFIDNRMDFIEKLLTKDVSKGKITEEQKTTALANLVPSLDRNDAVDSDLVIEATVENMEIKKEIFADMDRICKSSCIPPNRRLMNLNHGRFRLFLDLYDYGFSPNG